MVRTLLAEKRSEAQWKTFCQLIKAKPEVVLSHLKSYKGSLYSFSTK